MAFKRRLSATLTVVLVIASSLSLLSSRAAAPAASTEDFKSAIELYSKKKYGPAKTAFAEIVKREPQNMAAYLYLANSYYALGQVNTARSYYDWIIRACPKCPEAGAAKSMTSPVGGAAAEQPLAEPMAEPAEPLAKAALISAQPFDMNSMIRVVKPAVNQPACTEDFIQKVKDGLKDCPRKVIEYVARRGCKICVTPSLIARNPELRNTRPRGYEDGSTYKNVPAMYDGREVVVCQYAQVGEDEERWQALQDPVASLRHEFGHAIDHHLGDISDDPKYRHIYYLDLGKMDADAKELLAYYIQAGTLHGGPSECFAEACCILFGGASAPWRVKRQDVFKQSFPNVLQYVKKRLKDFDS